MWICFWFCALVSQVQSESCFYTGQAKEVGIALAEKQIDDVIISTADGCQGHECDLSIIAITKAGLTSVDGSGAFWNDERRVNVALSRGKFGMIVIGDFKMLWSAGGIWRRFLKKALEKTVAMTPDYIETMVDPTADYENGVLVGPNGSVKAANFYDEWKDGDYIKNKPTTSQSNDEWNGFANSGFAQSASTEQQQRGGRSGEPVQLCHRCRRPGHLIRDCLEDEVSSRKGRREE